MKKPTTRKNFTADIRRRAVTSSTLGIPGMYSVATSTAVMIASATATLIYVRMLACPPPWSAPGVAAAACGSMSRLLRYQVDDGEDGDPHDVHEVPVQPGDFHLGVVAPVELAPHRQADDEQQPDDAAGDVGSVESRQHEERGAEQAGREREPIVHGEGVELVDLVEDEVQAHEGGGE